MRSYSFFVPAFLFVVLVGRRLGRFLLCSMFAKFAIGSKVRTKTTARVAALRVVFDCGQQQDERYGYFSGSG